MRYIGGVVTVVALVFPLVILYKLWNTRRDSNINNGNHINQQSSSSSDVIPYVIFDSENFENDNNGDDNNNIIQQPKSSIITSSVESDSEGSKNSHYSNITQKTNSTSPFGTSSSMFDYEDSIDNIHITITQQPPTTSPSISHFENSDNDNNNSITQQLDSIFDLATPSVMSHSMDSKNLLPLPSVEYEVFLSFRGPDTRNQITEILYRFLIHSKIHTFKDDDEMRKGEGIWPALVKAINQSKVYVPILSENYAHSKWCLNELAEIVECRKKDNRRIILPIFYMVDPRDVRHQSGPYQKAFQQHEKMFDPSTIQSWRNALKEIGTLKGWHVKNNDEQIAISDNVCEDVCSHVIKSNDLLDNTVELVGIDDHVNAVINSLSLDSNEGMVMVGIHGIGGIGKTTLATSVYNKISTCFERCSFLENIRETQQQKDGILTLQKKLISDVMRKDFGGLNDAHEGRKIIRERVSQFKVLVVLDDVDNTFKFDDILGSAINFTPESRFIATSRDIKVLRSLNEEQCRLYEVNYMDHDRSLQLFCKHAFRKDSPPREFDTLSRDIVSTAGGLLLTLKVVGSLLYREEVNIWEEKLAQLKETTEKEVIERLKISYNSLEHEAKQIFLDIACFFIGSEKEIVSYMWADCNFRPLSNINILIQRSMIKINESNEFHMHDQLRDMGRDVVRCENIDFPWMRSRLWSEDDIMEMLRDKKGTNQVKGILLNNSTSSVYHIKSESFMNMSEIRYLETSNYVQLEGDFSNLLPNLRWLSLSNYGKEEDFNDHLLNLREPFTNLCMKNLVIFNSWGSLSPEWDGWHRIKEARRLKVLDLSDCCEMKKVPEFPESGSSIEILDLSSFSEGEELNIGKLRNLQVLDMQSSEIRKITGGTIGMLTRLRELNVEDCECQNLEQVLVDVEKLKCLKILRTTGHTKSSEKALAKRLLPTSLKELSTCSRVPDISEMLELEKLTVLNCHEGLDIPETNKWWQLSKLHFLRLRNTKINNDLRACANRFLLPSSLTELIINGGGEFVWFPNLANLGNLVELHIDECDNLREIHGLEGLKSLTIFYISGSQCLTHLDIASLLSYKKVQELTIQHCPLLTSLTCNATSSHGDDQRRDLAVAVVDSLEQLRISGCISLELDWIVLPHLSKFPRLYDLELGGTINCEVLTIPECLQELVILTLSNLRSTKVLNGLSKLRKLKYLSIEESPCLREIEGLSECKNLNEIRLKDCPSLEKLQVSGLEDLEYLCIERGSKVLERLPSLSNLRRLQELALTGFTNLREIGNIADLKCLTMLNLEGCEALERLPVDQLSGLKELWLLDIMGCAKLKIDGIDDLNDIETILPNIRIFKHDGRWRS
ncbi:Disease resistance protein L6 [Linum perenne]